MKYKLILTILICFGITSPRVFAQSQDNDQNIDSQLKAIPATQYRTWSVGVSAGLLSPFTIFSNNAHQDFTSPDLQIGYDVNIKDQLTHSFGLQADFMGGKLKADHAQTDASGTIPYTQFDTKLNFSASLSGNFIIAHAGIMQPYATFGVGIVSYTPTLHNLDVITNVGSQSSFFVPVGVGLKFNITHSINLDLGYQANFVGSDNVDGYVFGSTNDRYGYTHIGLEFALGKHSRPQMASSSATDAVKAMYLTRERLLKDSLQNEQSKLHQAKLKSDKLQNDLNATNAALSKYTTDSDGDGVADAFDKCPNTPADTKVDGNGCPIPVVVRKPSLKVVVTAQDKQLAYDASRYLVFNGKTAIINESSFATLDRLAQLLASKNLILKLDGYTDNRGKAEANLKLSRERANAVKAYLVKKGVNASRIEAFGYGEAEPIASNKTAEGRELNRRVEFTLY
ncbi:MAG: DUF6089 family protein [Mucilaginibacter sp.]